MSGDANFPSGGYGFPVGVLRVAAEMYLADGEGNQRYATDADGDQRYATDADGDETYAAKRDGFQYYARLLNGDEFYPGRAGGGGVSALAKVGAWGREIYARTVGFNEIYPVDASGIEFFARDEMGDEYPARLGTTGEEFPPLPARYPRDADGRSRYPVDGEGNQYYGLRDPFGGGHVVFGTDASGNQIYASDSEGREYYPADGSVAFDAESHALYARDREGKVVFKRDAAGNELYLPHLRRPLIDRYARSAGGSETYPEFAIEGRALQFVVGSTYARDGADRFYYPRGLDGDEYVDFEGAGMALGYPVGRDGYLLVPVPGPWGPGPEKPALVPGWGVTAEDLVRVEEGLGIGRYYVTRVTRRGGERDPRSPAKTASVRLFLTLTALVLASLCCLAAAYHFYFRVG